MRNSLRMMPYMLYALLIFALSGCGATGTTTAMDTSGGASGKLTVVLTKSAGKTVGLQADVTTTRIKVTGATIPTATKDFANSTGGTLEVYPGSGLIVTAQGFDASGVMIYEGFARNVTVVAGQPQTVSIVQSAPIVKAADTPCLGCHDATKDTNGQNLVANYKNSGHYTNQALMFPKNGSTQAGCAGCHGTQHNDLNPAASGRCAECHSSVNNSHDTYTGMAAPITGAAAKTCGSCHKTHDFKLAKAGCIGCHSIPQNAGAAFVQDNNGVRSVTQEFTKWSHHVTGVALNDAHCAACHLEGTISSGKVSVDPAKHMVDAKTHLRDTSANTDADFAWDPAAPNHSGMDTYCMSCHDSNGAVSPMSAQIQAFINNNGLAAAGKTASPSNPFGDTISNRYDKMQRPAVVDAKGQFATGNASHHAVIGKRYDGRTRIGSDRAVASTFANNSSVVLYGKRTTIFDAGKFESTYITLADATGETGARNGGTTLGDDSTLHCGDCHTVGQYRQADVNVKPFNKAVIGAHGSNNEYLLRNSIGTDERHYGWQYSGSGVSTNPGQPMLVCFMCHKDNVYNNYGATGNNSGNHAGEYSQSNRCNGPVNTISFSGYTTANGGDEPYAFRLGLGSPDKTYAGATTTSDTDFSNLFGIQCANCHNSGPDNAFGGIHGSRINVYTDANGAQQKPYRFLPGLGNTMFVPGVLGPQKDAATLQAGYSSATIGTVSDLNWEQKFLGTQYNNATIVSATDYIAPSAVKGSYTAGAANVTIKNDNTKNRVVDNSGCYTLVPEEGPFADPTKPLQTQPQTAPYSVSPAYEQKMGSASAAAGQTLFGEWGGCDDHRGNAHGKAFSTGTVQGKTTAGVDAGWIDPVGGTVATGGAGVYRKVLRPVSY